MISSLEHFEIIGDLYYRRFHRLRPGKDESAASGRSSMDDENIAQFSHWIKHEALTDATNRILTLQERVRQLEEQVDDLLPIPSAPTVEGDVK